jgi:probable addiction module antidote protein
MMPKPIETPRQPKTEPFDAARYLGSPEAQAALLDDVLASGDAAYVAQALGVVARARGMTDVAREAGADLKSKPC